MVRHVWKTTPTFNSVFINVSLTVSKTCLLRKLKYLNKTSLMKIVFVLVQEFYNVATNFFCQKIYIVEKKLPQRTAWAVIADLCTTTTAIVSYKICHCQECIKDCFHGGPRCSQCRLRDCFSKKHFDDFQDCQAVGDFSKDFKTVRGILRSFKTSIKYW